MSDAVRHIYKLPVSITRQMDLYFKKIAVSKDKKKTVEIALRKFAIKRNTTLDLQASSSDIIRDKYFLGLETDSNLMFTRIRTSFERVLPKLIICFPKDPEESFYKLRLSLVSFILFILLSVGIVSNTFYVIIGRNSIEGLFSLIIISVIFVLLLLAEINLTESRVEKAFKQYEKNDKIV